MNEPKEVLKVMAAAAGVGYSLQTTIVPENSGDSGEGSGTTPPGGGEPPPEPPPEGDSGEGSGTTPPGGSGEGSGTTPP